MKDLSPKPKILVVDDLPENIIALKMILKKMAVEVITASSGEAALTTTRDHDFSLILLDVMMPGMDGYEVAEILKGDKKTEDIPIIFITAMNRNDTMEIKGYSKGAIDYIFKPINEVVLLSKIKIYLDLYQKKNYIEKVIFEHQAENQKILIVDDHPENLFALEKILAKLDADIIKAGSGNEALTATLYNDFALIILDVQMPEMDGYEVAEILKDDQRTEDIPIIFVTAIDRDSVKEIQGYDKGAVDFIFKPLNEFILFSKVKIFLEIYRMKSGLERLVRERTLELEEANIRLSNNNSRLKKVVETTQGLNACVEMGTFGPRMLEEFASHMTALGGSLYSIEKNSLELLHSLDPGHAPKHLRFPLNECSIFAQVLEKKEPLLIRDVANTEVILPSGWNGYQDGSVLVFPILDNDKEPTGILTLHNKITPPFTEQDKEIGTILTSYGSETMRAAQAFDALHKSEKQYRTLFEKTNDAIFIVDRNTGRYEDANQAALDLTGRTLEELKGGNGQDVIFEGGEKLFAAISGSEKAEELGIVTYIRPEGPKRITRTSLVPLSPEAVILIAKDITRSLEVENRLRQSQKMESIGTLAGGIAHDFNNILFPIVGYTEMLLADAPEEGPFRSSLDEIYTATMRAKDLVKQILAFAHQESHELRPMRIQPIVKEAVKFIRSTIPTTIPIIQNINMDCGFIEADPTQIHQIVMNVMTNAYHAVEKSGGELSIKLEEIRVDHRDKSTPDLEPGRYATLTIDDTGVGMHKDQMEHIFDPFFTTKEKNKGTGMGLSVVHGIVTGMKGDIRVKSEPGKGTTFSIFLPIVEKIPKGETLPRNKEKLVGGNERIMLVDDEKNIIAMENQLLIRMGYKVTSCTDSIKALETFRKAPDEIDLVITDMAMPGLSGDKLSMELIKIRSDIPILICTGFYDDSPREKLESLGIKGFLMKPVKSEELTKKIREMLDNE